MGFGSYDESEQENQEMNTEDNAEAVNVHESEHDGEVTFDTEASTDDLVDKLGEIKGSGDD
ncbi:hypothetical protein SAMN05216226_109112 [Halovenus aranensis]|jgi:hypothetical protein|uniref:DUF5786 domain-containing protein n=1 Tax=Halovenus aranensis TaxID=890420 RepID=A0A1G8WN86_9EURY|nr:DUF5786 family protein [Halovenus aranensis]SDJ79621.1 hypothetical protein SAMN05216226_109112 [Halovenus aranensis]